MATPLTIQKPMLFKICLLLFSVTTIATKDAASATVGPIFIFGDSIVDVGTNNYLKNCTAQVNHPYYGVDYPHSIATGRFSNGLNPADCVVALLGGYKESPPPFLALLAHSSNLTGDLLHGVNFASGGAALVKGVRKQVVGNVVSYEEQIQQFATVNGNITALLGKSKGQLLIQGSMYIICVGSNDIVNYVFSHPTTPEVFIANITAIYAIHLKNLYNLGARKFGIMGVPPLGCCPISRAISGGACTKEINDVASAFYTSLKSLLKNLSSTLEGFKYSLANSYNMTMSVIENPPTGFKDVKTPCCGNHPLAGINDCMEGGYLCPKRDNHLFWDAFHPSEAASKLAARVLVFGEDPNFVTPINFSTLRKA
ncbi:GDSL esterase/lipase At5g33370-like [Lactuca sativa]|uniref:Uncharacterized protein n=1 Tax=Lactuca sativa TaxID=4236 RepID=A0A9R1WBJ6_LACSA|nr:GDSL esterase/lipase At5g33370-like [Lactuca sativa]KAJ0219867.1 hypothetical protein LSAT_V11C200077380 [Lactuca sativa]